MNRVQGAANLLRVLLYWSSLRTVAVVILAKKALTEALQVGAAQIAADPRTMRFTVIFDREGFSPKFFAELTAQRLGMLTYHKYPGKRWPAKEFSTQTLRLPTGDVVQRALAERGTQLTMD